MRRRTIVGVVAVLALVIAAVAYAAQPALNRQPGAEAVVAEHIDALNDCSVDRLMAQYPESIQILLPDGTSIVGRQAVLDLFNGFCTEPDVTLVAGKWVNGGGLKGLQFAPLDSWTVGKTINAQWIATSCFTNDYKGADAYETHAGLMAAQVSTFDGTKLEFNDPADC